DAAAVDESELAPTQEMIAAGPVGGMDTWGRFPMNVPSYAVSGIVKLVMVHASVSGRGEVVEEELLILRSRTRADRAGPGKERQIPGRREPAPDVYQREVHSHAVTGGTVMSRTSIRLGICFPVLALASRALLAQGSRITRPADDAYRVTLSGSVHPKAQSRYDQGPVDPSLGMPFVTLTMKPSAIQQAALERLL